VAFRNFPIRFLALAPAGRARITDIGAVFVSAPMLPTLVIVPVLIPLVMLVPFVLVICHEQWSIQGESCDYCKCCDNTFHINSHGSDCAPNTLLSIGALRADKYRSTPFLAQTESVGLRKVGSVA
jgi:hypothetical protein